MLHGRPTVSEIYSWQLTTIYIWHRNRPINLNELTRGNDWSFSDLYVWQWWVYVFGEFARPHKRPSSCMLDDATITNLNICFVFLELGMDEPLCLHISFEFRLHAAIVFLCSTNSLNTSTKWLNPVAHARHGWPASQLLSKNLYLPLHYLSC